jgi:HIRAN domain
MFPPITTKLKGVTFGDAQENIKRFGSPEIGSYALIREPENPEDPNAVRVMLAGVYHMGYLPRLVAAHISALMDMGCRFIALYVQCNRAPGVETVGLTVKIVEIP